MMTARPHVNTSSIDLSVLYVDAFTSYHLHLDIGTPGLKSIVKM